MHYKSQPDAKAHRGTQKSSNVKSLSDLSSFRNLTESATVRMLSGRAFQVAGPACENARSPNWLNCFRQIRRAATVVDGVDEAAQLEPYSVADRQPMQLDQGRRDVLVATQAEHQSGSCILDAL